MKLTDEQREFMVEDINREIIIKLMEEWNCNMTEAMDMYYNSDTFERLSDFATGLYYQSAGYIYDFLKNELRTGKME